jgi:acetyltransferase-like isoleucine patch superfamily enzyme
MRIMNTENGNREEQGVNDRVSSGDYSARGLFKLGVIRKKIGTLVPFACPMPSWFTTRFLRFAGVRFKNVDKVFVGVGVWFDSAFPEKVEIGEHVIIGMGVKILIHSGPTALQEGRPSLKAEGVRIEDGVMLGVGAIIMPGVCIGAGATVAAGAVVTKDVAPGDVVAGNPARLLSNSNSAKE